MGFHSCSAGAQLLQLLGSGAQAQSLWPMGLAALQQYCELPGQPRNPVFYIRESCILFRNSVFLYSETKEPLDEGEREEGEREE